MDTTRRFSPVSLFLAGAALSAGAQAEDRDVPETFQLEEVIVRSSPLRTAIEEIALGTTVLDRSDILRNLDGTIGETLARQPGVSSTFFGPGASRPIIRGLGGDRIRVLNNDISTFDVSTASNDHLVGSTEMATAERVEILRGAQTLRYGQNAVGGVVNVFDNRIPRSRPDDGFEGDVTAAYSTVDEGRTIGGRADVGLGDNLVFHVDGNDRDADEYEIPGFASEAAEEEGVEDIVENPQSEARSATAGLSWIGDRGYVGISVGFQEGRYGVPGAKKKEEEEEEGPISIDFEQTRVDLDSEYNFDEGLVKLAKFRFGWSDYEHTELAGDEPETLFTNDEWELRAEALLNDYAFGDGEVTGTVGLNVADREFEAQGDEAFVPQNEQFRWGVFGLGRYTLNPLILEASARIDQQENETSNLRFAGVDVTNSVTTFSAAVTGLVEITENTTVGLNLARSERAPTAEELFSNGFHPATSTVEIGDINLDTELGYSAELSFKTRGDAFGFGANLYFTDYRDFIFLSPTGDFFEEGDPFPADEGFPVFAYQQADAELYGFEVEADYLALDTPNYRVTVDAQLDLARGETTESTTFGGIANVREEFTPLGGNATTVPSGDLPFFPPVRFFAGVNVAYKPLNSTLRLEVQRVGEQDRVGQAPEGSEVDIPGTVPTDAFTFLNVYLEVQPFRTMDNVTLSLRARNLTDEFARSATSFLAQSAPLPGRDIRFGINVGF
ncbi:MAG: TonB-dependent receptor [Pseudomonadales bacterium]|jgi:iron complex outermembrane receptor protein|nr:TonB-dependent receptor [Pseudomonadales bacterium]